MCFKVNTDCDAVKHCCPDPPHFLEELGPFVVLCMTSASYGKFPSPLCVLSSRQNSGTHNSVSGHCGISFTPGFHTC